jgi:putative pyruvate formate lyase activating enzyme
VFQGKKPAHFLVAKTLPTQYEEDDSLKDMWLLHDALLKSFTSLKKGIDDGRMTLHESSQPKQSFLDLKIEIANRLLTNCHLCVQECRVNRINGELGWCRSGTHFPVSSIFVHTGEEPELVPSGTIFTIGCNLRCIHCQNWAISQRIETGETYTPRMMANAVEKLHRDGCRNLNMVGGDPTPWLPQWLETLKHVTSNLATVWNSNAYYSEESAKLLAGFADVYLLDFKYGNNVCAERLSSAPTYWETCTRNHLYAKTNGELIIRVLVLPGHNQCCTQPILQWIAKNLGPETRLNLMDQYRPEWRAAETPELRRRLTREEFKAAVQIARDAGLTNVIT